MKNPLAAQMQNNKRYEKKRIYASETSEANYGVIKPLEAGYISRLR
jgi:hypothetical protein